MDNQFTSLLEVQHLAKSYGKKEVVKDISFSMRSEERRVGKECW